MENTSNLNQPEEVNSVPLQSEPTQSSPTPDSKHKFKLLFIIGVIIFLLLIVGGASAAYFLNANKQPQEVACTMEAKLCPDGSSVGRTGPKCEFAPCPNPPTPKPTKDFTFTYPPYLFPVDINQNPLVLNYYDGSALPTPKASGNIVYTISVGNKKIDPDTTLDNAIKAETGLPIVPQGRKINLDGTAGKSFEIFTDKTRLYAFAIKNDKLYSIILTFNNPETTSSIADEKIVFNNILSSFKFVENQTINTSNWKTYTNTEYGFSFKYPNDWLLENSTEFIEIKSPDFQQNEKNFLEQEAKQGAFISIHPTALDQLPNITEGQLLKGNDTTEDRTASNVKQLFVGGRPAIKYDFKAQSGFLGSTALVESESKMYNLRIVYKSVFYKDIFDQILSTFKFTNQTTLTPAPTCSRPVVCSGPMLPPGCTFNLPKDSCQCPTTYTCTTPPSTFK